MLKPPLKRFPSLYHGRKPVLEDEELLRLFKPGWWAEEKLDGTLTHRYHEGYILMLEDMLIRHTVYYNSLPNRYILVDVVDPKTELRLPTLSMRKIARDLHLSIPNIFTWGSKKRMNAPTLGGIHKKLREFCLPSNSRWGTETMEGFVVKNDNTLDIGGKWSRLDLTGEDRYKRDIRNRIIGMKAWEKWDKRYGDVV